MESFNANRQRNLEINNLLQRIKYEADKQQAGAFVYFPIFVINGRDIEYKISPSGQILFKELKKMGAIELKERSCEEINKTLEEARKSKNKPLIAEGYLVRPIEPKFSQLCKEYEKREAEKEGRNKAPEQLTAKIEITAMPELKIKGFEERVILPKPKNKKIQLRKFPKDTKWQDITIQFLNEHEVIIRVKNETHQTTYEVMGFQDEKKKLPNKQWTFLRLLAIKNGELSWENNSDLTLKQINSAKKQKQLLVEALKAYFQIDDEDPFYDYKKEKAYRIKINLMPEINSTTNVREQEIYEDDRDDLGIEEYRKKQSPEVYDE
jgi:hypothetical protein